MAAPPRAGNGGFVRFSFNTLNHSTFFGLDPELPEQLEAAAAAGFDHVGLDSFSLQAWTGAGRTLQELDALARRLGVPCYELVPLQISADERATLAEADALLELAAALRPEAILVNVLSEPDAALARLLARCAERFAAVRAELAIEFMPFTPVNSLGSARSLIEKAGGGGAGVLLDTWHFFRGPDGWRELQGFPLELISFVQFDDALPLVGPDLREETIHRRVMPGDGEFDLRGFCARLRDKGFDGAVSVEILSSEMRGRMPHREFARLALERTRAFWAG
jgi:sugar phosphate isomerase/epimerase